jgi:hypothetical protein
LLCNKSHRITLAAIMASVNPGCKPIGKLIVL